MSVGAFSLLISIVIFVGVSWLTNPEGKEEIPADVRAVMEV